LNKLTRRPSRKRWKHIDQPHKSFRGTPYWLVTGILLDEESERHLLKVMAEETD
jgi:hypothetical protein